VLWSADQYYFHGTYFRAAKSVAFLFLQTFS
jgi:hypothetical protein